MSSPLPSNMALTTVRGRYGTWSSASPPEFVPYVGLQVAFSPAYPFVTNVGATPTPVVVATARRVFVTDASGYLSDPTDGFDGSGNGNNRNCLLVSSDDPDIYPRDWKYLVTFNGSGATNFRAFRTPAPAGATVDMAVITPQRVPQGTTPSTCEIAAANAAVSAAQAASSAASINKGQAGGTAPLDADGDVNDASGNKILASESGPGSSTLAGITDMSTLARQLNTDTTQAAMRSRIGAGTSNVAIGTTAGTAADAAALATSLTAKAADTAVVHKTGDETVAGIKTFSSSPVIPSPTSAFQAATKAMVDSKAPLAGPEFTTPIIVGSPTAGNHAATRDYADAAAAAAVAVSSVAGKTGAVSLVKADVGLSLVDNTADTAKPVSTAMQAALDAKVSTSKLVIGPTRPTSPVLGQIWILDTTGVDITAPTAPTLAVPTVTSTQVTLVWSGATDAVGVTSYDVYRSGVKLNASPITGTTYTDGAVTPLSPNTSYGPYLIRARDAAGNVSGDSNTRTVTTATTGDTTAPTTPTGLSATAGNTQVALSWTASTDAVGVTGYLVYINGTQVGTPTTNSYTATGLTNGVLYTFTVAARDAANNVSAQSSPATATPAAPADTTAPSVPTGLAATPGNTQVSLTWTASTDAVGVTGYRIYVNGTQVGTSTTTNYLATGLSNGTSYSFTVAAYDAASNVSAQSTPVSSTPTAPAGKTYTDTFSRADVTTATAGSTALGNGWTNIQGAWALASGQLKVNSNASVAMIGNTQLTDTNDMYVEAVYAGGAPTSGQFHICARTDSTGTNFLGARFSPVPSGGGNSVVSLERFVGGALTTLGSFITMGSVMVAGDVIRLEVSGTNLTAKLNGTIVATATTTSVPTGNAAAIRVQTAQNMLIDNVNWGDL